MNILKEFFGLAQVFDSVDGVNDVNAIVRYRYRGGRSFNKLNDVTVITACIFKVVRNEIGANRVEFLLLQETVEQISAIAAKIQNRLALE